MRPSRSLFIGVALAALFSTATASAQQIQAPAPATVPRLMQFNNVLKDGQNKPLTGVVPVTFAIYARQDDNTPLWMETQDITPGADGNYTAMLGSASRGGIPAELFSKGEARWLGVQTPEQPEGPRVLLVSVPYALKAADADTLGGLPASAFLTASHATESPAPPSVISPPLLAQPANTLTPAFTGAGTTNFVPLWTSSTNLGNSILFQSSGNLQVNGGLQLPATGTATTTAGFNSRAQDLFASVYNTSGNQAVLQHFRWQAEPVSNNTTSASGKLGLLYASGTATPAETGLSISSKGLITFASGQTLPKVTGNETVTGSVTATQLVSTGTLNVTGSINGALTVKANVTGTSSGLTSANLIGGYGGNSVRTGVTGATIGGGGYSAGTNNVTDDFGTVGGGLSNTAGKGDGSGHYATVAGGANNIGSGEGSTVAGGYGNSASGYISTAAGGSVNTASGYISTVAGGYTNTASGQYATVSGGHGNIANGTLSTVPGGSANIASGSNSFAAGYNASATADGSFVWCQYDGNQCASGAAKNTFVVAVNGPIYMFDGFNGQGCYLNPGTAGWQCSSDRNLKSNIRSIDSRSVLGSVARMPILQWSMKADTGGHNHIGPMAQDFYAAFGLGDSDKYIAQGDAQGVALASIQGLYRMVQEKDTQIRMLQTQLQAIEERMARFEAASKGVPR